MTARRPDGSSAKTRPRLLPAGLALVLLPAGLLAQPRDGAPVLRLPFSVEAAAVIGEGAELRATDVGAATWRLLLDAGLVDARAVDAWSALADSLRVTPADAFDNLLGRSATVVARGLGGHQPADWVLVCEISEATQRRLRDALRPAARALADASTILTVEGGRIELAFGASVDRGGGTRTAPLVIAPAESRGLFDKVRASLVSGGIPGQPIAGHDSPHVTFIWSDQGTSAWAEIRAVPTDEGWSLVSRSFPHAPPAAGTLWPDSAWRIWTSLDADPPVLAWASTLAGPDVPIPDRFRRLSDDLLAAVALPPDLFSHADLRAVRLARRDKDLSASLLLRLPPGSRRLAAFDEFIRSLLSTGPAGQLSPDEQAQGLALGDDHPGCAVERLFGPGHALRWFTLERGDSAWALADVRPFRADAADAEGAALRRRLVEVADDCDQPADPRRHAAAALVRPGPVLELISVRDGPLSALRWIDQVRVVVPPAAPAEAPTSVEARWTVRLDLTRLSPPAR